MKQLLQTVLAILVTLQAISQTFTPPSFADVDNNYRTYVNQVFGALEANRVSTGLLADYGFDFTDPKIYNGSVLVDSTLMEQGIYSDLYKTIFTSKFNTTAGSLRHPSVQDSLCYIARQKEVITLSGLLFQYNAIDPNAQANGKMQTVNGQLKDKYVNGVWQNPYQQLKTVAISPSTITYNLTYCSVVLPSNLFLSNISSQISSIQFNADDGLGYRALPYNTSLSLNYADTGWKHWMFKITLTSGQLLYSHSKVHFANTSNIAGSGGAGSRGVPDARRTITATESYNGAFGVADIIISYRNAGDRVLRRPLIVAEGFDPGWILSPEEPEGESTFDGFVGTIRRSNSNNLRALISDDPSQYDLVYVNWRNGTDFLQRNELVLEEVIRWINANKQPLAGVRQPNVVLGTSMGGVIARMALGRMDRGGGTRNGTGGFAAHQTRLYVSLDAPHQGANVPLGYQALARHGARIYISTGPLALLAETVQFIRNGVSPLQALFLADQPAAKQLLTNRIDFFYNQSNTTNQQFLQELRTQWAYPANIRNVAISDGSECAVDQEFAPGSSLLYHYRSTKTRFIGDLIFMVAGAGLEYLGAPGIITIPLIIPGSNKFELTLDIKAIVNGGGNRVYYGNIKLTKKVLWLVPVSINIANRSYNAPTGILPFDTYPGGFYTVTLDNQPGSASQDWMFTYNNSFYIQRRFSFIPTTSALDIGRGNTTLTNANYTARYIGATPPAAPFNTPFANFTTSFNQDGSQWAFDNRNLRRLNNQPHENLFIRSANWLAEEMNGNITVRTNCSAFCGLIISGSDQDLVCNSATYNVPFITGATYSWTASPSGIVTITNPTSNVITINRLQNGTVTLTANITEPNCLQSALRLNRIVTLSSAPDNYYISNIYVYPSPPQVDVYTSSSGNSQVVTSWSISVSNGGGTRSDVGYPPAITTVDGGSNCGYHTVMLTANNNCGSYSSSSSFTRPGCRVIHLSPNPANGYVTVTDTDTSPDNKHNPASGIVMITIFDKANRPLKQFRFSQNNQYKFSVAGLTPGAYIVQIKQNEFIKNLNLIKR